MGKRPAEVESFVGNMGSIQREETAFYAKRRTASHGNGTRTNSSEGSERAKSPFHVLGASPHEGAGVGNPTNSAPGVDGQTVAEAKESFGVWIEDMLQSVHRQGYPAPNIRR